jgi:hypothetical protein
MNYALHAQNLREERIQKEAEDLQNWQKEKEAAEEQQRQKHAALIAKDDELFLLFQQFDGFSIFGNRRLKAERNYCNGVSHIFLDIDRQYGQLPGWTNVIVTASRNRPENENYGLYVYNGKDNLRHINDYMSVNITGLMTKLAEELSKFES